MLTIQTDTHRRDASPDLAGSWALTIFRAHGLRLLRPEKTWRPIITVQVDTHETIETNLGADGQCINLKRPLILRDANLNSKIEIKVLQQPQSKKKVKKRNLVGTASHTLGELLRRQLMEPKVEVRLTCPNARTIASRGKPQNGAYLTVRLRPPTSPTPPSPASTLCDDDQLSNGESMSHPRSASPSPSSMSDTFVVEPELLDPVMKPEGPRIKGYALYSDEECDPGDEGKGFIDFGSQLDNIVKESGLDMVITQFAEDDVVTHQVGGGFGWLFPSLLPQYTADQISVTSTMSVAESTLDTITMYRELREASLDSQFEAILVRLQSEWAYVGASLVALAGLDATVFGIAPGSIFGIDGFAKNSIAVGSVASGLGLSIDAYFLLRYSGADVGKFQRLATDIYGTYFFFCLSSKVPALCMFVSACSLMIFLLAVAWDAWRLAVILMCMFAGILISLQFIVYGVQRFVRCLIDLYRATRHGVVHGFARILRTPSNPQTAPAPPPCE